MCFFREEMSDLFRLISNLIFKSMCYFRGKLIIKTVDFIMNLCLFRENAKKITNIIIYKIKENLFGIHTLSFIDR